MKIVAVEVVDGEEESREFSSQGRRNEWFFVLGNCATTYGTAQ